MTTEAREKSDPAPRTADFEISRRGATLTITFDRPDARNALNRATRVALVETLEWADDQADISAIIITGTDPAFSSGLDAKELLSDPTYVPPPRDPATQLRSMSTPTIAAVNGICVSGALEIAISCSFIIASDRAIFRDTHAALGLTPGWGLSAELPATIGVARARQMTLTGLPVDAATALTWGLVNEVVDHSSLLSRADHLAEAITAIPPRSARNAIDLYRAVRRDHLAAAYDREREVKARWSVESSAAGTRFRGSPQ